MSVKVAINGFGRIGRCFYRIAHDHPEIEVVAINDLGNAENMAHLLKYDSTHGRFGEEVSFGDGKIVVDGKSTPMLAVREPSELPWKDMGVDVALECTGIFRTRETAGKHLTAGARKVVISAPAKGDVDNTIVMGVNDNTYDAAKHHVISNASCTTNCLAPAVKVLNDLAGVERGIMTTVHAVTNDQALLDLPHKDFRRGRSAMQSMVPTTTGAAKAVGLVLPELNGKLDGISIRVPTRDVSVVDLVAEVKRDVTAEEIANAYREAAKGPLKGILRVSDEPFVSIDATGDPHSSIVDSEFISVLDKRLVKLLSWYDNEWGFSARMVDLVRLIAG